MTATDVLNLQVNQGVERWDRVCAHGDADRDIRAEGWGETV